MGVGREVLNSWELMRGIDGDRVKRIVPNCPGCLSLAQRMQVVWQIFLHPVELALPLHS